MDAYERRRLAEEAYAHTRFSRRLSEKRPFTSLVDLVDFSGVERRLARQLGIRFDRPRRPTFGYQRPLQRGLPLSVLIGVGGAA